MTPSLSRSSVFGIVGARYIVPPRFIGPLFRTSRSNLCQPLELASNANPSRHKRPPTVNLTPLEATLTKLAVTIATKGLTKTVSPLYATFAKKQGVPVDTEAVPFES